jgi:pimeloyl-ACP methyl ester carboxylesterase
MATETDVRTNDGRTLRVRTAGEPSGLPVLLHHGTPGNGSHFGPTVDDARAQGIRLIAYDRPGYGDSTAFPGRTVADCAQDVEAIVDALGYERLAVWGISGGGPHALACGALLGERVAAVASLASVAPRDAAGLEWTAGMGADNIAEFEATRRGREALEPYLDSQRSQILAGDAEQLREVLQTLLTPVDAAALTGEFAEFLDASAREGLRDGVEGWLEDDLAFFENWAFDVGEVRVPVLLWHGEHDLFVPIAHGRWLAERLPNVDARLSDEDGHLTLGTRRLPEVHAWLAARLQA